MIGSHAYDYINVLNKAAGASWARHEIITNNITNNSTPNYKRKEVEFESFLQSALIGQGSLDQKVANMNLNQMNFVTYTDHSSLSYRLDGNNVDIDVENAYLAQNQIRYYTLLDSMTQEFKRIETVLAAS